MHRRSFLLALGLAASFVAGAQTKRPIRDTDIYDFHWIADARISPDGSRIAYTLVNVNAQHDVYETTLWLRAAAHGATARHFPAGPLQCSPHWCPPRDKPAPPRPPRTC